MDADLPAHEVLQMKCFQLGLNTFQTRSQMAEKQAPDSIYSTVLGGFESSSLSLTLLKCV